MVSTQLNMIWPFNMIAKFVTELTLELLVTGWTVKDTFPCSANLVLIIPSVICAMWPDRSLYIETPHGLTGCFVSEQCFPHVRGIQALHSNYRHLVAYVMEITKLFNSLILERFYILSEYKTVCRSTLQRVVCGSEAYENIWSIFSILYCYCTMM